jgi:predicted ester cyclase
LNIPENHGRIAEQFNEAFNRGDLDAAANCFAEDCQNRGRKVGRADVRTVLGEIKINFSDARVTTLNSVAEGEWVVVRCTYSGTHRRTSRFPVDGGMLVGVQPTGRTFEVQHIHMYRVLDGKIRRALCQSGRCSNDAAAWFASAPSVGVRSVRSVRMASFLAP